MALHIVLAKAGEMQLEIRKIKLAEKLKIKTLAIPEQPLNQCIILENQF